MSNPSNRLRASLEDYYIIELNDPINSNNLFHPGKVTVVTGKIIESTPATSSKDATLLLQDTDELGRRFTHRIERFNIKNIISNVNFYSYGNHSLLHGLNTYIKKYGGYTKKNKEIKKNKKTKTKKNNEIKKK